MSKRVTPWKEGKIVSIETRKGIFILAQMLKNPFLRFYKVFREDENWEKADTGIFDTLSVTGVTGQFLKSSNITEIKEAIPDTAREDPDTWINQNKGTRTIRAWKNTEKEKEFIILGKAAGGSLVKKNLWWSPTPGNTARPHPSGVIDSVVLEDIPLNANDIIDAYDLTNLAVYPSLNERLYLCYKLGKNVDPYKDLVFNREIPDEYSVAIDILSAGGNTEKKENILNTYFR